MSFRDFAAKLGHYIKKYGLIDLIGEAMLVFGTRSFYGDAEFTKSPLHVSADDNDTSLAVKAFAGTFAAGTLWVVINYRRHAMKTVIIDGKFRTTKLKKAMETIATEPDRCSRGMGYTVSIIGSLICIANIPSTAQSIYLSTYRTMRSLTGQNIYNSIVAAKFTSSFLVQYSTFNLLNGFTSSFQAGALIAKGEFFSSIEIGRLLLALLYFVPNVAGNVFINIYNAKIGVPELPEWLIDAVFSTPEAKERWHNYSIAVGILVPLITNFALVYEHTPNPFSNCRRTTPVAEQKENLIEGAVNSEVKIDIPAPSPAARRTTHNELHFPAPEPFKICGWTLTENRWKLEAFLTINIFGKIDAIGSGLWLYRSFTTTLDEKYGQYSPQVIIGGAIIAWSAYKNTMGSSVLPGIHDKFRAERQRQFDELKAAEEKERENEGETMSVSIHEDTETLEMEEIKSNPTTNGSATNHFDDEEKSNGNGLAHTNGHSINNKYQPLKNSTRNLLLEEKRRKSIIDNAPTNDSPSPRSNPLRYMSYGDF